MPITSINPATGEKAKEFSVFNDAEIEKRLSRAEKAFKRYRRTILTARAELLHAVSDLLFQEKKTFAEIITLEMGKLFRDSVAEIEKCARGCRFYAENGARFLEEEPAQTDAAESYVEYQPLGPVLAVMPWNFPFWQVFRFAAPALMAGNAGILKHASNVPRTALAIQDIFQEAGFPRGLFSTVLVGSAAVPRLIADPRIVAATLTGSDLAGRKVAEQAGRELKKTVLELGGSDPFLVLADADLAVTSRAAADARLVNSGQSCIAAKRFIVVEAVAEAFVERFAGELRSRRVGNPLERETQVGPLARADLRDALHRQVQESIKRGAKLVLGGQIVDGKGAFYPPTLLTAVETGMPAFDDETFGPVAAVIRAKDETDAVRLANASPFGLGASIWTRDRERGERLAAQIEAGSVFVNGIVKSDPRLPFGGIKRSGYGRELSEYGIREFVNIKTVWIA